MISCNNCNVIVTKLNFCSDKCRVQYHRHNAPVTKPKQTLEQSEKIIEEFVEKKKEEGNLKLCKHGAMIGLCKYNCK